MRECILFFLAHKHLFGHTQQSRRIVFALFVVQDGVTPDVLNHVTYEAHENANLKAKEWGDL